jgi:hypothetical protein
MADKTIRRLLIVGNPQEHHVGAHLLAAAAQLGLTAEIVDVRKAWSANRWFNRFFFHLCQHRPARLRRFDAEIVAACDRFKPELLLVSGISPPSATALEQIGRRGIGRCNFLTDDPWNPKNGAGYFWQSLRQYDVIYNPRRSNLGDLVSHGCRRVEYLPFGYNPALHFPESPSTAAEKAKCACDVAIVGGGDADRIPVALALVRSGLKVSLYGGYWDRHPELTPHWRGFVHGRDLRLVVGEATVNIGFVRQANRDGHAMRSLEFPAMAACLVVEDTAEHRELFGKAGDSVEYYSQIDDMVQTVKTLCAQPERARLLGRRVVDRICRQSKNTYADRLQRILADASIQTHP